MIEFAIGHRPALERQCHRVRCTVDLSREHLRDRTRGSCGTCQHSPITPTVQSTALFHLEHINRHDSPRRVRGHRPQNPPESLDQRADIGDIKRVGVVFDANAEFMTWQRHHRQRVMVVFTAGEFGDPQLMRTHEGADIHRVVLVQEEGVEQTVVAG
ncbi:Uncharacterised protein [Mycobacteroides abscessus subsp. abscessus]|nr:Uncharacterised protein [Mycobacteroides abscessus subsp. abscessus]